MQIFASEQLSRPLIKYWHFFGWCTRNTYSRRIHEHIIVFVLMIRNMTEEWTGRTYNAHRHTTPLLTYHTTPHNVTPHHTTPHHTTHQCFWQSSRMSNRRLLLFRNCRHAASKRQYHFVNGNTSRSVILPHLPLHQRSKCLTQSLKISTSQPSVRTIWQISQRNILNLEWKIYYTSHLPLPFLMRTSFIKTNRHFCRWLRLKVHFEDQICCSFRCGTSPSK